MLKQIIVLKESNLVLAFDTEHEQVLGEQGHLVELYCRALLERGVVTNATTIHYYDEHGHAVDATVEGIAKNWTGRRVSREGS